MAFLGLFGVLQSCHMSNTLTIRLPEDMVAWLKESSRRTGVPVGRLIRQQLELAKAKQGKQKFMRQCRNHEWTARSFIAERLLAQVKSGCVTIVSYE
jgi:hypothetical protein